MKLSELRWAPSALRPHCEVNVPREALRPARGAGATAVAFCDLDVVLGRGLDVHRFGAGLHRGLGCGRLLGSGCQADTDAAGPADRDHCEDGEHPPSSVASLFLVRHGGNSSRFLLSDGAVWGQAQDRRAARARLAAPTRTTATITNWVVIGSVWGRRGEHGGRGGRDEPGALQQAHVLLHHLVGLGGEVADHGVAGAVADLGDDREHDAVGACAAGWRRSRRRDDHAPRSSRRASPAGTGSARSGIVTCSLRAATATSAFSRRWSAASTRPTALTRWSVEWVWAMSPAGISQRPASLTRTSRSRSAAVSGPQEVSVDGPSSAAATPAASDPGTARCPAGCPVAAAGLPCAGVDHHPTASTARTPTARTVTGRRHRSAHGSAAAARGQQ